MAETHDLAVYEIETRRVGDRTATRQVRDEMLSTLQVQRAAAEFDRRYGQEGKATQQQLAVAERERSRAVRESLTLLSLRARTADLSSATEVAAIRQAINAQFEQLIATKSTETEHLKLATVEQQLEKRIEARTLAQERATQASRRAAQAAMQAAQAESAVGLAGRVRAGLGVTDSGDITRVPARAREAANALNTLSFMAVGMGGSMRTATIAAGSLASGIAMLSSSAKVAATASGIGALIVVLGTIISLLHQTAEEAEASQNAIDRIGGMSLAMAERQLAVVREQKNAAVEAAAAASSIRQPIQVLREGKTREQENLEIIASTENALIRRIQSLRNEATKKSRDDRVRAEEQGARDVIAIRARLATEVLDLEHAATSDAFTVRRLQAERAYTEEVRGIRALAVSDKERLELQQQAFQVKNRTIEALEKERALLEAQAQVQIGLDSENSERAFEARMRQIELEKQAEIERGISVATAEENAQQKIRRAQRERFKEAVSGYAMVSKAAVFHGTVVGKIAEFAAEAIRRYEIFTKAKDALLSAKMEYAAATAAFAKGNIVGGLLHGVAAGGYAAAAAFGFAEAGAGGGGGGASGGGAGGPGMGSTFDPDVRGEAGAGGTTIILQTTDPYNRENIRRTIYEITRSGTLGRPIYLPPTTGIQDQPWS